MITDRNAPDSMRLALMEPNFGPIDYCTATRANRAGWTVATCTFPAGLHDAHTDIHEGHTWTDEATS